ncbi:MAG: Spore protein SP21 [candidate division BRC1 bacterium ADurb.BinA364]|nr:MAG: Spore protein SP21 [candidate division BRC1 bacterium ADurb.BinA364]
MSWMENTIREMDALRREIDREVSRAFDDSYGWRGAPFWRTAFLPGRRARGYPLVNLSEDKDAYYVEALAPGVKPESLNITVAANVLTISGEKNGGPGPDVQPEAFHRSERAAGKFVRSLTLPEMVNDQEISADYKNGLLLIKLPKAEVAKPKRISVNVS